jgi:hypothetical protein
MSEPTTNWPELAAALLEKLTARDTEFTWEFQNLEVRVPQRTGAEAPQAHWRLNGVLKLRAHDPAGR